MIGSHVYPYSISFSGTLSLGTFMHRYKISPNTNIIHICKTNSACCRKQLYQSVIEHGKWILHNYVESRFVILALLAICIWKFCHRVAWSFESNFRSFLSHYWWEVLALCVSMVTAMPSWFPLKTSEVRSRRLHSNKKICFGA